MNFHELALRRVSARSYRPDPVPEEDVRAILETARLAPSAANRQPWRILVVRDEATRRAIHQAYPRDWLLQAPLVLAICVEPAAAWVRAEDGWNAADTDAAILMTHIILAAAERGLGTCWIAAFSPTRLRVALRLPDGVAPMAITPLGYPTDAGRPKTRKSLAEIVREL